MPMMSEVWLSTAGMDTWLQSKLMATLPSTLMLVMLPASRAQQTHHTRRERLGIQRTHAREAREVWQLCHLCGSNTRRCEQYDLCASFVRERVCTSTLCAISQDDTCPVLTWGDTALGVVRKVGVEGDAHGALLLGDQLDGSAGLDHVGALQGEAGARGHRGGHLGAWHSPRVGPCAICSLVGSLTVPVCPCTLAACSSLAVYGVPFSR